jgi:hypothetical protein
MLIEKARQLLGDEYKDMSDEEVKKLTEMLKSICSIVVEDYLQNRDSK